MLTPEQFHKSESKYKPGDFKTSKEEIVFAKNPYNENFNDTFTQSEERSWYFFIGMFVLVGLLVSLGYIKYQYDEIQVLEKKIRIQEVLITGYYEGNYGK